jgi:L-asparaginase
VRRITLITTGGTIEKTYDEATGQLLNQGSIVSRMLRRLRLEETAVRTIELMSKDSLVMTDEDRRRVVEAVRTASEQSWDGGCTTGIVILHGTDRLAETGERLVAELMPRVSVVLTGAMRPFEMKRSDALQNLTEAIFAAGVLSPGIYCIAHGRALRFPGVRKDRERNTFTGGS